MECLTPPHNPRSSTQKTLVHNQNKPMENLQDFVFKLAKAHPNAPLPPPAETLLRDRLHRFVSQYRTPEHPPYSAMIQNALQELNEKGGSSEESISRYLDKKYDNLPSAHPVLLKHHLEETCESGDIVVTRAKKYRLAGSLNLSKKSKSKPRQRRWTWECKRQTHNQLKIRLRKKITQQRGERAEVNKKHHECDVKEQRLTENGVHGEDKQDQMKNLQSCVDGEKSDHTILPTETPGMIAAANDRKFPEEVRSQLENAPSAISESDIWDAHTQEHQEKEQSEHGQPELSTPERPPGFESVRVENLPESGSTEPETASAGEVIGSTRMLRQLKCRSRRYSVPRAVTVSSSELVTPHKAGGYDSPQSEHNMETPPNQQQALDSVPITLKQTHHDNQQPQLMKTDDVEVAQSVTKGTKLTRDGGCGLRRNNMPKEHLFEPYMTIESCNVCLTSNESEFALLTEQELAQQPQAQQEETFRGKQLRRSPRALPAKPEVAKDANTVDVLSPECFPEVPLVKVFRHLGRPLKQRPSNQPPPKPKKAASVDVMQDQPKSKEQRVLLKRKPNTAAVESLIVVDDCREQDFQQSGKLSECTSMHEKMEPDAPKLHLQEEQKKPRRGGPPKRRSARLLKIKKHG